MYTLSQIRRACCGNGDQIITAADGENKLVIEAERRRSYSAIYSREASRAVQEIGPLPEVADKRRRSSCAKSFRKFCETYFAEQFPLKWSKDHLRVIKRIQQAVLHGGLFAMAMPRGSGKTTLCETAAVWAVVNGHRRFPFLIGADESSAEKILASIKVAIEHNDLLNDDYPEICHPIRSLEGALGRCKGQRLDNERTHIQWKAKQIVLPTVVGSVASGSTIQVSGITGSFRGARHRLQSGEIIRPDLVLLDDPQTDESAKSQAQNETREALINGAVLGLAGPNVKISGLCACTIIRTDDLADRLLDRGRNPQWQGETTRMVIEFGKNEKIIDEYREERAQGMRLGDGGKAGNDFYRKHRKEIEQGWKLSWPQRKGGDLSAVQHAINLRIDRGDEAFFSEYQNCPLALQDDSLATIEVDRLCEKITEYDRGVVPAECDMLTVMVDVQKKVLFYTVVAWERDSFTGHVIDYGSYPDQQKHHWSLREAQRTLEALLPGQEYEAALYAAMDQLSSQLLDREWARDDGEVMHVDRMLIDANWGQTSGLVKKWCRQTRHRARVLPSHGKYVGAATKPISDYRRSKGDWFGSEWMVPSRATGATRHVLFDANHWKTFVHDRLLTQQGGRGCLSLFKAKPSRHRMFAEQVCAEYRIRTAGRGRTCDEWKLRPGVVDNHFLDCLVGAAVAASMSGAKLGAEKKAEVVPKNKPRKKVSYL